MKSPEQVTTALATTYRLNWRTWLVDDHTTLKPTYLSAPDAKSIKADFERVATWIAQWESWATQQLGVRLEYEDLKRTAFGPQTRPTYLHLADVASLAQVIGRGEHWSTATARWAVLSERWPKARRALKPLLTRLVDLDEANFQVLLAAAAWLRDHPRSGYMARQVPVAGMHTKWLRRHTALLHALLDDSPDGSTDSSIDGLASDLSTDPAREPASDDEIDDARELDRLGLRPRPHLINVILADPADRSRLCGIRHLAAPPVELAALPLTPSVVLVVENKESALIIPDRPGLVIVHSLGDHIDALDQLPWVRSSATQLYWGDLDRAGFTILARARSAHLGLQSVLMDPETLQRHGWLALNDGTKASTPGPDLTPTEFRTYGDLLVSADEVEGPRRLEQERLPSDLVIATINQVLDRAAIPM